MTSATRRPTHRTVLLRMATRVPQLALLLQCLFLGVVFAKRSPAASKAPDASMIHALTASAPNPALGYQAKLFNSFVGSWDFDCTALMEDGKTTQFRGEWIFGWILEGRALQDVWIGYENNSKPKERSLGTTLRFYDPHSKDWRVIFVVPESGKVLQLRGGAVADSIVLVGTDVDGSQLRWSFHDITPESFLWRGETSSDNGKTWKVEQIMKLRRTKDRREK